MTKRKTDAEYEAEVSARHAALRQKRQEELARNPTRDVPSLTQRIREMIAHLDGIPEDHEFGTDAMDALDDCRDECWRLTRRLDDLLD